MFGLLPLLFVPTLIALVFRAADRHRFSVKEFLALEAGMAFMLGLGFLAAREGAMSDTEVWSGRIAEKIHGRTSCCHCHQVCTGSGKTRSCRTVCSHSLDHSWSLAVTTGDRIVVNGCTASSTPPSRWDAAVVGEPAAVEHRYRNYLLADPETILARTTTEGTTGTVPGYPEVFDLYRIRDVLNLGTKMPVNAWNAALFELNADLGRPKEVHVVVIATTSADPRYADLVERQWLFGKKNDLIFVLGAPDGETTTWARVVTISKVETLKVRARDALTGLSLLDPAPVLAIVRDEVLADWKRTSLDEFAYLASAAKPSTVATVLLYVLAIVGAVGGSIYMSTHDVFGDERQSSHGGYPSYDSRPPWQRSTSPKRRFGGRH